MINSRARLDKVEATIRRGRAAKPWYSVAGFQTFRGTDGENRIVVMQGTHDESGFCLYERAGMNVAPLERKILEGD
jgi:hypothetical protein